MQGWVESWRQGAAEWLVALVVDHVRVLGEHRHLGARSVEEAERRVEHAVLERRVEGPSERPAEGELAVEGTGRPSALGLAEDTHQADGGQASSLEDVGERAHGARAHRSDRSEQDQVDAVIS
jgi:hypothetical protein